MELKKALETALEFEKKGQKIYSEEAKRTENPIAKKTFEYLAKQELKHIQDIQLFMGENSPDIRLGGDTPKETEEFFNTTIRAFKKKTHLTQTDKDVYHAALELEQSSYDFYEDQLKKAKDSRTKKFFEFLVVQENSHYAFLSKTLDFIKHPELFFIEEDGTNFEG